MLKDQNRKEDLSRVLKNVSKLCRDKTVRIRKKPFEVVINEKGYSIKIDGKIVYINNMCNVNIDELLYLVVRKIDYVTDKVIVNVLTDEEDEDFVKRQVQNYILFD